MSRTERTITTPGEALAVTGICFGTAILSSLNTVAAGLPTSRSGGGGVFTDGSLVCKSRLRLRVKPTSVLLMNGADAQAFDDLDIYHSCEGGSKYGGAVIWLLPEFGKGASPFIGRFNANEEKGIAVVDMRNSSLKKRFPLHNRKMRKCSG